MPLRRPQTSDTIPIATASLVKPLRFPVSLRVLEHPRQERESRIATRGTVVHIGARLELPCMTSFARDVRFALRSARRSPAFTLVALVTLAVGIGAATATFSVANAIVLRALSKE